MSKELRVRQQTFYRTCKRLDAKTLALLLNTISSGIDWRGSTKADMLMGVFHSSPENFLDCLTERHVKAALILAEKVENHRRNLSKINAAHNHDIGLFISKI